MKRVRSFLLLKEYEAVLEQIGLAAWQRFRFFRITTLLSIVVYLALAVQMQSVDFNHILVKWLIFGLFLLMWLNYFLLSLHQKPRRAYVVFLVLAFSILHLVAYYSGGIRNNGILYFAVLILAAYMLVSNRAGMIMAGLALLHIIYFYCVSTYTNWANYDIVGYTDDLLNLDFLVTGIIAASIIAAQANYIEECKRAVVADIKSKSEALKQERKLLRTMIDNLPDYIYVKDTNSHHVINNKANIELLGATTEEEIIGKTAVERLGNDIAAAYLKDDQHVFKTGEPIINREEPLHKPNGEKRWLLTTKVPLKDGNNQIVGLVGISRDITELKHTELVLNDLNEQLQKRAEALAFSNAELERFAYVVSHDLQEPLRMVNSFLKLLEKQYGTELDARAKEYITFATGGAEKMKRLILGLLEYSRVGANTENFVPVNLNDTLKEVLKTFGIAIEHQYVSISVPELPVVRGIPLQLQQLFQNFISNSIKYRKDIPLEITISCKETPGHYVFSVKDNGIGINPKHFEKIFRVFQRVRNDERYAGTGIGLAICKKIVEKHKGTIWVSSEPGEGSTFYFTIPDR